MKRSLCKAVGALVGSLAVAGMLATTAHADVNVNIYQNHGTTGDGFPYSNLWTSFTSPAVTFGTDTGFMWKPAPDLLDWGADITGCYMAPKTGDYLFGLVSDDGSTLRLDGSLIVDSGGAKGTIDPTMAASPLHLTAGQDLDLEIRYFEDFRGHAGLDLYVKGPGDERPRLVTPGELDCASATPEPCTLALLGLGAAPLALRRRSRKA